MFIYLIPWKNNLDKPEKGTTAFFFLMQCVDMRKITPSPTFQKNIHVTCKLSMSPPLGKKPSKVTPCLLFAILNVSYGKKLKTTIFSHSNSKKPLLFFGICSLVIDIIQKSLFICKILHFDYPRMGLFMY